MADTTELRTIKLIGPKLALENASLDSTHFCWNAVLAVSYLGKNRPDLSLVNSTLGLRVALQAPESDAKSTPIDIDIPADPEHGIDGRRAKVGMQVPYLLTANLQGRKRSPEFDGASLGFGGAPSRYVVRAAKPDEDPDTGPNTLGFSTVLVAPLDPWPTPQTSTEIEVPRFALSANRLRVIVSAKGGTKDQPLGFLRLAKISNDQVAAFVGVGDVTDLSKLPRIELPTVNIKGANPADGPFVALDLTPDGIEFRGTVANPLRAFDIANEPDRINVVLRLVHIADPLRPQKKAVWTLELVREEDESAGPDKIGKRIREALSIVRSKFHPSAVNPLFLDINTGADDLAVRWPLDLKDQSVRLPGKASDDWLFWVDRNALRGSLNGSPVRDGELPTEVALVPNRIELGGSKTGVRLTLDADRRDVSLQDGDPSKIAGPKVTLTAARTVIKTAITSAEQVTWFLDRDALARSLMERYEKAGVQPAGATKTYAFLPIEDGWLQLPLKIASAPAERGGEVGVSDAADFEGSVEYVLDDQMGGAGPVGRRVAISAADYVHVEATFKQTDIQDVSVELSGAAGTVDGLLWVAAGSPSPEDILPSFDAGPAALTSPLLTFRRATESTADLLPLSSGTFKPGQDLKLKLPKASGQDLAYLWSRYVDMPLVSAIGMTRTSESASTPSATRGMVCRELDRSKYDVFLEYDDTQGIPTLTLSEDSPDKLPLAGQGIVEQVPLVPVTLPGIELQAAAKKFADLKTRLRFDLPILDELYANTRLPEKPPVPSGDTPVPLPPPDAPTSLVFDRLLQAWQKAVDRLDLSRVQKASAFAFSAQQQSKVPIRTLVEGVTWSPDFRLDRLSQISGMDYGFGSYTLDGEKFFGRTALQGLTKTFAPSDIRDIANGTGDPVKVVGFAASLRDQKFGESSLWRDTRAALFAQMPTTDRFGDDPHGIVFREAGVIDPERETIERFSYATIFKPIEIQDGDPQRKLGFWFRDLPLKTTDGGQGLAVDPDGPELSIGPRQSAYDRSQLPRALYEWRFCNDAVDPEADKPFSAYETNIGLFRLRPLRLLDLQIKKTSGAWQVSAAKILFTVSLRVEGASTDENGPFEPDLAYTTGNLVAVSMPAVPPKLGFGKARWEDVQVATTEPELGTPAVTSGGVATLSFRMTDVPVKLGREQRGTPSTTTAVLGMTLGPEADAHGMPTFAGATLDTVLLGRSLHLDGGVVSSGNNKMSVIFQPRPSPDLADFSGVLLNTITVEVIDAEHWTIILDGVMRIVAIEPALLESTLSAGLEVVSYPLGGSLAWLNASIPSDKFSIAIDHQRGVISLRADWSEQGLQMQPIAGLSAQDVAARAILVVAIRDWELGEERCAFRSVSGFGEFNLTSTAGPTTRFDHIVVGAGPQQRIWSSTISADLALKNRRSRIGWPIGSLPDSVKTLHGNEVSLTNLGARVTGAALRGQLTELDAAASLVHTFTMVVTRQSIQTSALGVTNTPRCVRFTKPWSFHALTEHTLAGRKQGQDSTLKWTSLDHVSAVDGRALVAAARSATKLPQPFKNGIFSFAARYQYIAVHEDESIAVKAGIVLRAFAQAGFPVEALALEIANIADADIGDGIIISGAGPSVIRTADELESPFWPDASSSCYLTKDPQGVFLALPWLGALDDSYTLHDVLKAFDQAPANGTAEWDAPDVDWAAGSPTSLDRRASPVETIGNDSADIAALLQRVAAPGGTDPNANRALAATEQSFLRRFSGGTSLKERPIWLRSLLVLRTLWNITVANDEEFGARVTMVIPSGETDGKVARIRLLPRSADPGRTSFLLACHGELVAIDRHITKFEPIPSGDSIIASSSSGTQVALSRMRQVARADRLVDDPVAILVIAENQDAQSKSADLWIDIEVPRDLDNSAFDIPIKADPSDRLYASPALGWPTSQGTSAAASGALGMGGDWPFQDIGPVVPPVSDDVKSYGSGLSGRATSISLPARANRPCSSATAIDTISPPFYTLGRKMIFDRPTADSLPLVSPPARYLTSSAARSVVPVARELRAVLSRVVKGKAAPIVPPHLERITFGLRPGAIQAEFDMLIFTDGADTGDEKRDSRREDMNPAVPQYGRPGHGGPRLMRQLRPPRGPVLPRVPWKLVKSYGRRTFVEVDDLDADGRFVVPFRLFEGVASVLRRNEKSFRIRVLDMPLTPEWNDPVVGGWTQGNVTLDLTSPSYPKGQEKDLADALAALGLLREGRTGLDAALSIDRFVVPFSQAVWSRSPNGGGIRLTLHADDIAGARARLDAVDGDSEVLLQLRCGQEDDSIGSPEESKIFKLGTQPGNLLTGQTWAGGQVTFTTAREHGVALGSSFTVFGSKPDGYNGAYVAVAGTATKTLVAVKTIDPGASAVLGTADSTTKRLQPEVRRQIVGRLPVRQTGRPSLNIDMSTLVFADPSYDRELSGPGPSDPQRDNAGVFWKLALDRFEYGADTPMYFAFGAIDVTQAARYGLFSNDTKYKIGGWLQLARQPFKNDSDTPAPIDDLTIAAVQPDKEVENKQLYLITACEAYGISFDQLRHNGQPISFADGDEIVASVLFEQEEPDPSNPANVKTVKRTLSCRAKVVSRKIIAPPPAVYSLVVPGKKNTARVVLHATAPLPQRVEFPALLDDLAIGHIRRQALFVWPTSNLPALAPDSATLVKIDRAGGGQLPELISDIPRRDPLPKMLTLHLVCTEPAASQGKEATLTIAVDNGPWPNKTSIWTCSESQGVFFNSRTGTYKASGSPNLVKSDGSTGVGLVAEFDVESTHVGSRGSGQSLETTAKFVWTVIDIKNGGFTVGMLSTK